MDNDNTLDLRHLVRVSDDGETELNEKWDRYSSSTETIDSYAQENYLDGKAKRRLRRKLERQLKKKK